jgi:hypothetical protein
MARMYGAETAARWAKEVQEYDQGLGEFYQTHSLNKLPTPPPPVPQDIRFDFEQSE